MPPPEEGIVFFPRRVPSYRVTDVRQYLGRGLLDTGAMTAAVQQAIDDTPDGGAVYFPHGTYSISMIRVVGRQCLTFVGDGCRSVLRWDPGWLGDLPLQMMLFDACPDLEIRDLAFHGGGLITGDPRQKVAIVYALFCQGLRVQTSSFQDDEDAHLSGAIQPPGLRVDDSGAGAISDNTFFRYGLRIGSGKDLRVVRNTLRKTASEAAILVRTASNADPEGNDDAYRVSDLLIADNVIEDPWFAGVRLTQGSEFPDQPRGELLRVSVLHNSIRFTADNDPRSAIGITLADPLPIPNPRVEDVVISDNVVISEWARPDEEQASKGIFVSAITSDLISQSVDAYDKHEPPAIDFVERLVVARNSVIGFADVGIELIGIRAATVSDNGVYECGRGILLVARETHVHSNRVLMFAVAQPGAGRPRGAYVLGSYGRNIVAGNVLLDGAQAPLWEASELNPLPPDASEPLLDEAFETDSWNAMWVGLQLFWETRGHDYELVALWPDFEH